MEEIAKELLETIRWIPQREKQSRWYMEYLDKINKDLKGENEKVDEPIKQCSVKVQRCCREY